LTKQSLGLLPMKLFKTTLMAKLSKERAVNLNLRSNGPGQNPHEMTTLFQ